MAGAYINLLRGCVKFYVGNKVNVFVLSQATSAIYCPEFHYMCVCVCLFQIKTPVCMKLSLRFNRLWAQSHFCKK